MSAQIRTSHRIVISEKLKENTQGAIRTTIELLSIAAQMTQSVPYLGAISTALTEFMKIQDEVDQCKDECKEAMDDAEQINALIKKFRNKCMESGREESALNETLREAFTELERIVLECITTLQKCKTDSKRKRDRLRLYWKRADLLKSVQVCAAKMGKALQRFDRTLHVDVAFLLEDIRVVVDEIRDTIQSPNLPQDNMPATSPTWRLRAAPLIFYGRDKEVNHAVDLIVRQAPARVAVLGSGGIGKTSIALAVLHHPEVKALYADRRCFMSCETTTTADEIVGALAEALGLQIEKGTSTATARHHLFSYLGSVSGVVCLDNLETPWDTDTAAVEDLLAEIASLPSVALLVTSRVTDSPLIRWSSPPLDPIAPFSIDAALQTWDVICTGHNEHVVKLVKAVDCVPLAVTLLARLARSEPAETIWARWEKEHTELLHSHGAANRLNNLGVSIELSLQALEYQDAVDVLSIISIFPDGLVELQGNDDTPDVSRLEDIFGGRLAVRRALTLLKQLSLIYVEGSERLGIQIQLIRVLSPIRHHMQDHHRVSDEIFLMMASIAPHLYLGTRNAYLLFGFDREGLCRERCFQMVVSEPGLTTNVNLLARTIEMARTFEPHKLSELHRWLVHLFVWDKTYVKARYHITEAIQLAEKSGDRKALFENWKDWLWIFVNECEDGGAEHDCRFLDEVQEAIQKAWKFGCDESRRWDRYSGDYVSIAWAQHFVNEGRRKLHMPVVHRSGLYSDDGSTVSVDLWDASDRLTEKSYEAPWDLSVVLESLNWPSSSES
ncbi:hypothetical protein PENSPDRAFT_371852 [Peniophora sp. CONT]|nr:hypothetical protein PENSPDRAFT_371852 [Peniophora sp. CONT]